MVYEDFTHFFFEEDIKKDLPAIETEYQVTWLPDQYTFTSNKRSPAYVSYQWNQGENYITFNQSILGTNSIHLNTEKENCTILEFNNQLYYYNKSGQMYFIIWTNDDYAFNLACSEAVGWDNVLKILESIKPK